MAVLETNPTKWWDRTELQQAAWGKRRPDYGLRAPDGGSPTHHWVKNVRWWRDNAQLSEGNFTRALQSLERRGLIISSRQPGRWRRGRWRMRLSNAEEMAL